MNELLFLLKVKRDLPIDDDGNEGNGQDSNAGLQLYTRKTVFRNINIIMVIIVIIGNNSNNPNNEEELPK